METLLFNGKWDRLEDFVLYGMPPSHDICFLTKANDAGTQTYIFCLDPKISARLKIEFALIKLEIDLTASYEDWIILGNKNLLPDGLWQIRYGKQSI